MAMSRSMGGRLFTTVSPIKTSPDVMDSSPATIRKVVVLPQPEGPTRTTNSLSRISRFTSFTACTPSNILFKLRSRTRAIASSLHGAGKTGDIMLDKEGIDNRHRDRAEQCARHQRPPEEHIPADELRRDTNRHGFLRWRRQEHQRVDELIPRQRESEDAGRQDARDRHWKNNIHHRLPAGRSVDPRALLQFPRDRFEISHEQPRAERDKERRISQNKRPWRVAEAEIADDVGQRDEEQSLRNQVSDEDASAEAACKRKVEAGERVTREQPAEYRDDGGNDRDEQRVPHPGAEQRFAEQVLDVLERRMECPERRIVRRHPRAVQLAIRTHRRYHHPVERKQQHEDEHPERDVEEDPTPPLRSFDHY